MDKESGGKYRHELKYVCSEAQMRLLAVRAMPFLRADPHAGEEGAYNIRSLYFDDMYNTCYYENQNGTDPREKFRIRIYNQSTRRIQLELKKKQCGKTYKNACPLTFTQCRLLMHGIPPDDEDEMPPLLRKLCVTMRIRLMRPRVIVDYRRTPLIYPHGNVRITFDRGVASGYKPELFLDPVMPMRPILAAGTHILEVKFDEFLPDFIYRSLQLDALRQTTFSKYYLCRKYALGEMKR